MPRVLCVLCVWLLWLLWRQHNLLKIADDCRRLHHAAECVEGGGKGDKTRGGRQAAQEKACAQEAVDDGRSGALSTEELLEVLEEYGDRMGAAEGVLQVGLGSEIGISGTRVALRVGVVVVGGVMLW